MQTIYSILSVPIRPEIQENLTVGFLLISPDKIFFDYSKSKLNVIKELVSENSFKLIKDSIRNIEIEIINFKERKSLGSDIFESSNLEMNTIFSSKYINYLSRYNNNLFTFSAPKSIDVEPTQEIFNLLYSKFIDYNVIEINNRKTKEIDFLRLNYFPKLTKHYNIEKEVTSNEIKNLLMPVKVDLIGKNKIEVFAHSIDLERKYHYVESDMGIIMVLNKALEKSKGFIISKEPDKKIHDKQHSLWTNLRSSKLFTYLEISEVEKIEEYAKKHGVLPLIAE